MRISVQLLRCCLTSIIIVLESMKGKQGTDRLIQVDDIGQFELMSCHQANETTLDIGFQI
jgi:hypothetical protein